MSLPTDWSQFMRTLFQVFRPTAVFTHAAVLPFVSAAAMLLAGVALLGLAPRASAAGSPAAAPLALGAPDAAGGMITLFTDPSGLLRVQRVDASGTARWPAEGVLVSGTSVSPGWLGLPAAAAADGAGGVVVTWLDARTGADRVYAQRIDVDGTVRWGPGGVALNAAAAATATADPAIAADGSGGAFVAWADARGATGTDVYMQHLTPGGAAAWTANGVLIADTPADEWGPRVQADGAGGAIMAWTGGKLIPRPVRAQRVDAAGTPLWTPGGTTLLEGAGLWRSAPDGAGGLLAVCVRDSGTGFVAQRVTPAGTMPWGTSGAEVARFEPFVTWGQFPEIVSDDAGGAIVAWYGGTQSSGTNDVRAARVSPLGALSWAPGGVWIGPGDSSANPLLVPDEGGGAIVAWTRNSTIRAQRVDVGGSTRWSAGGETVCAASDYRALLSLAADGMGGATLCWSDRRDLGAAFDVYAQRLTAGGTPLWRACGSPVYLQEVGERRPAIVADAAGGAFTAWVERVDGVQQIRAGRLDAEGHPRGGEQVVCAIDSRKGGPFAVPDGEGGMIVAWSDTRSGRQSDVYAQRVDSSGALRWTADGLRIAADTEMERASAMCSDGAGGVFIAWTVFVVGTGSTVRAQHVDANGAFVWGASGALVSAATQPSLGGVRSPCVAPDGQGGMFVAWVDGRAYSNHCISGCGMMIFARRVNASGAAQWTVNGIALRSPINGAYGVPEIAPDWSGGAFVVWDDLRDNGVTPRIYGQHVDASGALAWATDGLPLCASNTASHPALVASAPGQVILAWADSRSGTGFDLYAQHVGYPVPALWAPDGVAIAAGAANVSRPALVADGAGGAIAAWEDSRDDAARDVWAQRFDRTGAVQWNAAGAAVSTGTGAQALPAIAIAPLGGSVVAWQDSRGGFSPVVAAQRLSGAGAPMWTVPPVVGAERASATPRLSLAPVRPNPARGEFEVTFALPDAGAARLELVDIAGRRIAALDVGGPGAPSRRVSWRPGDVRPGLYVVRLVHAAGARTAKVLVIR